MIKIGIHNTGNFASAALFKDGEIIYACANERLTRNKYDSSFPFAVIEKGLTEIGMTYNDIDEIVLSWNSYINASNRFKRFSNSVNHPMERLHNSINAILPNLNIKHIDVSHQKIYYDNKSITFSFVNHHYSHIGMAYNTSPFESASVFISDGFGEETSSLLAVAKGNEIKILKEHNFPHSLGMFYGTLTEYCGFKSEKDEWKIMGASAYGNPERFYSKLSKLIHVENGNLELDLNYFDFYSFNSKGMFSNKLIELLEDDIKDNNPNQKMYDIASATQLIYEESSIKLINWLHSKSEEKSNLCLGGGTAMNSLFNGKVTSKTKFKNVFISFSPDDTGNAIGSVLYKDRIKKPYLESFLGSEYSNNDIKVYLNKYKLKSHYFERNELNLQIAKSIFEGKIVGWFQGRMEYGQRALGNRSILANPCDPEMKNKLNKIIKYRESFRPFAPAIIDEYGEEYFENYTYTPYMEKILKFKDAVINRIPAVVHDDNTGRLQSVSENDNFEFYQLIQSFYKISGIPILINTSFNVSGEPIVSSPEDAIKTFYTSGLDILVLNNYVIFKEDI
ncbi:hypothetical protein GJV85_03580 [Sulfurimonas aquatica]|uniref:Carbamoyltransferase n=1 Tax=Sulfurimonas aquatica TaxID=2672570 RepID=A0A975AZ37_9BACT|nr:carbamoyltransferase C-terminal domain-containing protein [Sulfurimonas aquatica]QSZ41231.1 hypothetical protein GJV85_03580 [Sulfurimonas aquatica]